MNGRTKTAVIGAPISHSLSPHIHAFWRGAYSETGSCEAIYCPDLDSAFQDTVRNLRDFGYAGANVTLPHKARACRYADELSPTVMQLGVANTLTFANGLTYAENTDVFGFEESLKQIIEPGDKKNLALVVGAGGASPAVCLALKNIGYRKVVVTNRTDRKASDLAEKFSFISATCSWSDKEKVLVDADVVINCSAMGMANFPDLEIDFTNAQDSLIAVDIVYTPAQTHFLHTAHHRGLRYQNGLGMLMHQAVPGFEKWFGKTPEVTAELESILLERLTNPGAAPVLIGLTGSIGMGKSTAAKVFEEEGAYIWDADSGVHRLYSAGGGAVQPISEKFPGTVIGGAVSRDKLSSHLVQYPDDFKVLEKIVHPLVGRDRAAFIERAMGDNAKAIVLDIPLLFETGQSYEFDEIVVVTADQDVRRARVLERPGMTEEKLSALISRQMPEEEKIFLADHVVRTDASLAESALQIRHIYRDILEKYQ